MKLNPQTHLSHGTPEANTHQWYITDADAGKLCANCHSSNVGPEALKAQVESLIETAGEKLSAELKTELLAAQTAGKTVYIKGTAVAINAGTTITWAGEGTFNIGTTSGSLSDITSDAAKKINIIDPAGNLRKGVWNVYLIELDGSYGVHNPSFIIGVLNKTISKF
jgi:hypothetical protein